MVSHENRLRLLWQLFSVKEMCVNQLMDSVGMTFPNASIQLQSLRTVGLVLFRREKMRVIYRAEADLRMPYAPEIFGVLKQSCLDGDSFETVIRQVTAFTHGRRVEIARALDAGALSYSQLLEATGMTSSALSRHLGKLKDRGFVGKDGSAFELLRVDRSLGRVLSEFARNG